LYDERTPEENGNALLDNNQCDTSVPLGQGRQSWSFCFAEGEVAVRQAKADVLVTECYPYGGNLRTHGYAIICAEPIPVLSV